MNRFFQELFERSGYPDSPRVVQVIGGPSTGKTSALCQLVVEDFQRRIEGEGFDTHPVLFISCGVDLSGVVEYFSREYFSKVGKDLFFHNFIAEPTYLKGQETLLEILPKHPCFVDPDLRPRIVVLDSFHFESVSDETVLLNFLRSHGVEYVYLAPREEPMLGEFTTIECLGNGHYQLGQYTNTYPRRTHNALLTAYLYGPFDGDHHKAYAIDQMVRNLTEIGYRDWVEDAEHGDNGEPGQYDWDTGIAP